MPHEADVARIRREILERVRDYHDLAHADEPFVPGSSPVAYAGRVFDADELVNLVDSALEFWLTHGRFCDRFERNLASYLNVDHALLVSSGSSANLLAFMALTSDRLGARRIGRGDEVITVAAGFPTTIAPIVQFGATPVFVDVRLETANVDVAVLDEALSARTRAVMLAHTLGNPFEAGSVREFCDRHDLWLIEDNCDALGSVYRGRLTGTFGDVATSSFYPPHHISMGEGGAVYTNDDQLHGILRSMRDWGRDCVCPSGTDNTCGKRFAGDYGELSHGYDHKYVYSEFGFNFKATEMQGAIGCAQLEKLPHFVNRRRANFTALRALLEPVSDALLLPEATPGSDPSWFGFLMTLREGGSSRRGEIVRSLESRKVQTRMLFGGNMTRQPCFDSLRRDRRGYRVVGGLDNTDKIMNDSFWVGVYPGLTQEALEYVAEAIVDAVRARSAL